MTPSHRLTLLLLSVCSISVKVSGQSIPVRGQIRDTAENLSLSKASVLFLRASDSILIRFTRTDGEGRFAIPNLPAGSYLLRVSYPNYADYEDQVSVPATGSLEIPPVAMILKSRLLQEVVVTNRQSAIRFRGDTTEYRADSFRTQPGATVEALLRQLPGIQVDRNGKITAQGKQVQKVLVDGEEFFGDDPTLVTQNLRANMIDKVQVYDKKSDQAVFTGIDDGKLSKTINLTLKEDKKNGYFGKAEAGLGTEGYYNGILQFNAFKGKRKMAAYGMASNFTTGGLSWGMMEDFGEGMGGMALAGGMMVMGGGEAASNDLDNWDGNYGGQGFPLAKSGGLHYNDKWGGGRHSVNGNYKVMQLDVNGENTTDTRYILPDTQYFNHSAQRFANQVLRHSANGRTEIQLDSSSTLIVKANGSTEHKKTNNSYITEALASDSALINHNERTIRTDGDKKTMNSALSWQKKLPKKGRTLMVDFTESYTGNTSDGFLHSDTRFYQKGMQVSDSLTDQYKKYRSDNLKLGANLSYTEPLSTASSIVAKLGWGMNRNQSNRQSFNASGGKYTQLDSLYSNDYLFNVATATGGLFYSYKKKKWLFHTGTDLGSTRYSQEDRMNGGRMERNFVNWFPRADIMYTASAYQRLYFTYDGQTSQPTLDQIQPVRTNEDPLHIKIGNPDLKPQFQHNLRFSFDQYKVMQERGFRLGLNGSFTQDAIGSLETVDGSGRRVTQAVNINGNYNFGGDASYMFKWKGPDLSVSVDMTGSQSANNSYVNGLRNKTESGNGSFGLSFYKYKERKYMLGLRGYAMYTHSRSSIASGVQTDYWTWQITPDMELYGPWRTELHLDGSVDLRPKTSAFDQSNNVVLLNSWIGKKFLKGDALLIKVSGNDLLNQNKGFNRTVNTNFITQNTYTTIRRYFLFSVVWNFTHNQ